MSQNYNAAKSVLYANGVKLYQFKAKVFELKPYPSCLEIFQNVLQPIIN